MAKTHKQHLRDYGYKPTSKDPYNNPKTEEVWQMLVRFNGEDNVWDFRVVDTVFDLVKAEDLFGSGIFVNVVNHETGEVGALTRNDFPELAVPVFYSDWSVSQSDDGGDA